MPLKVLLSVNAFNVPCSDKIIIFVRRIMTFHTNFNGFLGLD